MQNTPPRIILSQRRLVWLLLWFSIFLSMAYNLHMYYHNILAVWYDEDHSDMPMKYPNITKKDTTSSSSSGMAACLMIRDDNALLSEWLAYHYVMLPLRMLVIGVDMNSTEDPSSILERYTEYTSLSFTIWNYTAFMYRFGEIPVSLDDSNHHYIHRQRAFLTSCAEYMHSNNQTYVAFVDTDEYIILNRPSEKIKMMETTNNTRLQQRIQVFVNQAAMTIVEAFHIANQIEPLVSSACHVMPRLLYSALENETCDNMEPLKQQLQSSNISYKQFNTLRFVQHAQPGAFYPSKWGKVIVDVSKLNTTLLNVKPKNAHRPFLICAKPLVQWEESFISVNHYLGSYQQYSSRKNDSRRSVQAFMERAYFSYGEPLCENKAHEWLERLIDEFGIERAKYLLTGE